MWNKETWRKTSNKTGLSNSYSNNTSLDFVYVSSLHLIVVQLNQNHIICCTCVHDVNTKHHENIQAVFFYTTLILIYGTADQRWSLKGGGGGVVGKSYKCFNVIFCIGTTLLLHTDTNMPTFRHLHAIRGLLVIRKISKKYFCIDILSRFWIVPSFWGLTPKSVSRIIWQFS